MYELVNWVFAPSFHKYVYVDAKYIDMLILLNRQVINGCASYVYG